MTELDQHTAQRDGGSPSLLVSQRLNRVSPGRPVRRQEAGQYRHEQQDSTDDQVRDRVRARNPRKQARHGPGQSQ